MRTSSQPWALVMALIISTVSFGAAAAAITSVSPISGLHGVATPNVNITLAGLAGRTPTGVRFGTTASTVFAFAAGAVANTGTITCTAPISVTGPGAVDLEVFDGTGVIVTRTRGFFYTNDTLIVTVKVNIPQIIAIAWDSSTGIDDAAVDHSTAAQSASAYTWFVNFGGRSTSFTELGQNYISNSATEGRKLFVKNLSPNNKIDLDARGTNATGGTAVWNLVTAASPGTDEIRINAQSGTNTAIDLTTADLALTDGAGGVPLSRAGAAGGADVQELVLTFYTPADATQGLNVDMTSTITLTATAD